MIQTTTDPISDLLSDAEAWLHGRRAVIAILDNAGAALDLAIGDLNVAADAMRDAIDRPHYRTTADRMWNTAWRRYEIARAEHAMAMRVFRAGHPLPPPATAAPAAALPALASEVNS